MGGDRVLVVQLGLDGFGELLSKFHATDDKRKDQIRMSLNTEIEGSSFGGLVSIELHDK